MKDLEVSAEITVDRTFRFNGEIRERNGTHYLRLSSLLENPGYFPSEILEEDEFCLEVWQHAQIEKGSTVSLALSPLSFTEEFLQQHAPKVLEDVIRHEVVMLISLRRGA